jgi:hypothetical protein
MMRRFAYRQYSEAHAAHWLLLLAADRVDVLESRLRSAATGHPDNPVTETGILSEFSHHGLASRIGQNRTDLKHQPLDVLIVAAPWLAAAGIIYTVARRIRRHNPR